MFRLNVRTFMCFKHKLAGLNVFILSYKLAGHGDGLGDDDTDDDIGKMGTTRQNTVMLNNNN